MTEPSDTWTLADDLERLRSACERVAATIPLTVRAEVRWVAEGCCYEVTLTYCGDRGAFHWDNWWELWIRLNDELEGLGFSVKSLADIVDDAGRVRMVLLLGLIQPE